MRWFFFFFQAEDGIRDLYVTGVQTCALPICGGIGGAELGLLGFERRQLAEQHVVFGVRHFRPVELVIRVARPLQDAPQFRGPLGRLAHRPLASSWITAIATPTRRSSSSALARGSRPSAHAPSRCPNASSSRRSNASSATPSSPMRRTFTSLSCCRSASRS